MATVTVRNPNATLLSGARFCSGQANEKFPATATQLSGADRQTPQCTSCSAPGDCSDSTINPQQCLSVDGTLLEDEVRQWMNNVIGQNIEGSLQQALHDGVLLCELVNSLQPGTIPRINSAKMPFLIMENINNFLNGCRQMGVPDSELFVTVDLYENRNFNLVVRCIISLARMAVARGVSVPALGPKQSNPNPRYFTNEQSKTVKATIPQQTAGSYGNATQAGMHDASRCIVKLPHERYGRCGPATGRMIAQ